jgi:broad specificity phosphatase PhoE
MALAELILVRHGESTGNVAREQAETSGAEVIPVEARDADVGLTELGASQAHHLGLYLRGDGDPALPTSVWTSPYARARQTAELVASAAELNMQPRVDERLRDKELGVLDTLTSHGIRSRFPGEAERRRWLGKFYYRAPGGESWADLGLRLRSFLADLDRYGDDVRALVVTHDAVIMMARYVCEGLDERQVLALAKADPLVNTGLTRLLRTDDGAWQLVAANQQEHLLPDFAGADLRTVHPATTPATDPAGQWPLA